MSRNWILQAVCFYRFRLCGVSVSLFRSSVCVSMQKNKKSSPILLLDCVCMRIRQSFRKSALYFSSIYQRVCLSPYHVYSCFCVSFSFTSVSVHGIIHVRFTLKLMNNSCQDTVLEREYCFLQLSKIKILWSSNNSKQAMEMLPSDSRKKTIILIYFNEQKILLTTSTLK